MNLYDCKKNITTAKPNYEGPDLTLLDDGRVQIVLEKNPCIYIYEAYKIVSDHLDPSPVSGDWDD